MQMQMQMQMENCDAHQPRVGHAAAKMLAKALLCSARQQQSLDSHAARRRQGPGLMRLIIWWV